jgi:predicted site-specific integrase-resolvase
MAALRPPATPQPPFSPVIPISKWAELRGLSISTARRLVTDGKLRAIKLSARRLGIRADDDAAYLAACSND